MNPVDEKLNRLLKAAAAAPKQAPGAAVFALEARVLGQWRGMMQSENSGEFLVAAFRRAAIFGGILAIACLAWNLSAPDGSAALRVADSAMGMGVEP